MDLLNVDGLECLPGLINCTKCYGSKHCFIHECCLHCEAVFKEWQNNGYNLARAYWHNYRTRSND